jgi:hypothetical protein
MKKISVVKILDLSIDEVFQRQEVCDRQMKAQSDLISFIDNTILR